MHATTLVRSAGCAAILALILSASTSTNPAPDPHAIRSKRERVLAASSAAESGRLMVVSLAHSLPQEPLAVPETARRPQPPAGDFVTGSRRVQGESTQGGAGRVLRGGGSGRCSERKANGGEPLDARWGGGGKAPGST